MQGCRLGVIAVKRWQHHLQSLSEQIILERFHGGFILPVANQIQLRRSTDLVNGRRRCLWSFVERRQAANEILLEQVQIAFDDFRAMVQVRIFLNATHELALSLIRGFAASRHPDQSLQIGPESLIRRQTNL